MLDNKKVNLLNLKNAKCIIVQEKNEKGYRG